MTEQTGGGTGKSGLVFIAGLVLVAMLLSLWLAWQLGSAIALQPDIRFGGLGIPSPVSPGSQPNPEPIARPLPGKPG